MTNASTSDVDNWMEVPKMKDLIYPLDPNVNMHILHTVLYTFPKVLTRRFSLLIKSFFCW